MLKKEKITAEKREALLAYLPAVTATLLTALTIVLYITVCDAHYWTVYCSLAIMLFVPLILTAMNRRLGLGIPNYLVALMCLHAVLSVDLGTTFGFYGRFAWWDSSVHCFFGLLACGTLYYLYIRWKGETPKALECLIIVLLVISFAAIWEVYEFVASAVLGADMQDVALQMAQGINPLTDTVVDILVATLGAVVFYGVLALKRLIVKARAKKQAPAEEQAQ